MNDKDKENANFGKELINSTGIFLVAILASFVLPIIGTFLFGYVFFYFNFIPFLIGPVVLIIFVIRGIRLFRKTRSIKLVTVSVAVPLLFLPSLIFLGTTLYPPLNNLPINLFKPQTDFVVHSIVQNIQKTKLEKLATDTKVNPAEVCVVREYLGKTYLTGRTGDFWAYRWNIEWKGSIKFPQGEIPNPYGAIVNSVDDYEADGMPYIETTDGMYEPPHTDAGSGNFLSDGTSHKWKVVIYPYPAFNNGVEYKINLAFSNTKAGSYSEMKMGNYYTVIIPDLLMQKLQDLYKTENIPGYFLKEYNTRPLTEAEQLSGEVCVSL